MKILVTGGSGFVCRHLLPILEEAGHELFTPRSSELDLCAETPRDYVRTRAIETIIHLAARYGGIGICEAEPANLFYYSSLMNLNVLQGAAESGVRHVIMCGSACSYPGGLADDHVEDQLMSGPLHGSVEGYGFTKRIALTGQRVYRKQYGIIGAHPILANLYGEYDDYTDYRSHVVAALIKRFCEAVRLSLPQVVCWGDGSPIREFLHAEDAAEGIARCLEHPDVGPVNIGTGVGTSIKDLVKLVVEATGYEGEVKWDVSKPAGTSRKVLCVQRARELLDFDAGISLVHGILRAVNWFRGTYPDGFQE